jgi:hypothetical protein
MCSGWQASPVRRAVPKERRHGELDRGVRHVGEDVDALAVDPLAGDVRADVGLVLVVRRHDLDPQAGAFGLEAVLHGHPGRQHRPLAGDIRVDARHVGQDADLHHAIGNLRGRRSDQERCANGGAGREAEPALHCKSLPFCFSSRRSPPRG